MRTALDLAGMACMCVWVAWIPAGFVLFLKRIGRQPAPWAVGMYHELKPFYLPAVAGHMVILSLLDGVHGIGGRAVSFMVALAGWYAYRDEDDDDRWKRRRKRLAEKVQRVGARLAVVPAGAGL